MLASEFSSEETYVQVSSNEEEGELFIEVWRKLCSAARRGQELAVC